jgi:hypothetical protein
MARLTWGDTGTRFFETGVDRGVLYVGDNPGVPWNGLISVDEKPSGGSATPYYIDGDRYYTEQGSEEFGATINAYTYPDEFAPCDGSVQVTESLGLFVQHQPRMPFNLSYRTLIGNDVEGTQLGYKVHLLYGLTVAPTERQNNTVSDSPSANSFSWEVTATPPALTGYKPSAHFVIDSRTAHPNALSDVEGYLYGSSTQHPQMPDLATLISIFEADATLRISDNGDGTWTATTTEDGIITLSGVIWSPKLVDNFDDDTIDYTIWASAEGTETSGQFEIGATSSYPKLQSLATFGLEEAIVGQKLSGSGTLGSGVTIYFGCVDVDGNAIFIKYAVQAQTWSLDNWGDASATDLTTTTQTLDMSSGDWIAMGNIGTDDICHVYHSSDGTTWTEFCSFTVGGTFDIQSASLIIAAADSGSSAVYTLAIDNVTYYTYIAAGQEFSITWDSAAPIDDNSYSLGSL